MNITPNVNFPANASSLPSYELAKYISAQGFRVGPVQDGFDDWVSIPIPTAMGVNPWAGATTDVASLEGYFTQPGILVGVASGGPTDQIWHVCDAERKTFVLLSRYTVDRPTHRERSTEFISSALPDLGPLYTLLRHTRESISQLVERQTRTSYKLGAAKAEVARYQSLLEQRDQIRAELNAAEALAFISDVAPETSDAKARLTAVDASISESAKTAQGAKAAIKILEDDATRIEKVMVTLRSDEGRAEAAWLLARQAHHLDEARLALHKAWEPLSKALAVESARNFPSRDGMIDRAWRFLVMMREEVPASPLFPDWKHTSHPPAFPGFSAASAALDAELNAIGDQS
ncbi:hypothetical protein [Pararhizobium gei]|uniref:hypothetical protein n=1 Tax=Pararhizobium gei TaxID=1395951 RepID=UPI0023DA1256|nr:hypothetical protein [Rhizobium gei]